MGQLSLLQLLTIILLLFSLTLVCRSSRNCSASHGLKEIRELRLKQLRTNILAQLGFTDPPTVQEPDEDDHTPSPEVEKEELELFQQFNDSFSGANLEHKCTSDEFYAKPITSFVGIMSPTEGLVSRYRQTLQSEVSPIGDESEEEVIVEPGILNQYIINIDFDLPENLTDISRANLLLYQIEANTLDDNVLDRYQLVQIRTVIDQVRYSVEQTTVDIFGHGLLSFDITLAVKQWILEGIVGNVALEVLVTCHNSLNCTKEVSNGKQPAKVSFIYNTTDTTKLPRIITISKNPLESGNTRRIRRDSPPEEPPLNYCDRNESTCCLHQMEINFERDLSMPWIIRPKSFIANFCDGYCIPAMGLGDEPRSRELLRQIASASSVDPCCTGIKYKSLQIVTKIWNSSLKNFKTSTDILQQVSVTECQCS